jgi:hypothetical protein
LEPEQDVIMEEEEAPVVEEVKDEEPQVVS